MITISHNKRTYLCDGRRCDAMRCKEWNHIKKKKKRWFDVGKATVGIHSYLVYSKRTQCVIVWSDAEWYFHSRTTNRTPDEYCWHMTFYSVVCLFILLSFSISLLVYHLSFWKLFNLYSIYIVVICRIPFDICFIEVWRAHVNLCADPWCTIASTIYPP